MLFKQGFNLKPSRRLESLSHCRSCCKIFKLSCDISDWLIFSPLTFICYGWHNFFFSKMNDRHISVEKKHFSIWNFLLNDYWQNKWENFKHLEFLIVINGKKEILNALNSVFEHHWGKSLYDKRRSFVKKRTQKSSNHLISFRDSCWCNWERKKEKKEWKK